jgi:hypothetical protein
MVERCCYGTCYSDTRYPERLKDGSTFFPFPQPGTNLEKFKRWIRLCGRPHEQLNLNILSDRPKAKHSRYNKILRENRKCKFCNGHVIKKSITLYLFILYIDKLERNI